MSTMPMPHQPLTPCSPYAAVMAAACVLVAAGPQGARGEVHERPAHLKSLEQYDLEPTAESLGGYLRALHPSGQQRQEIARLVAQLGHSDYEQRESAMRQLLRRPTGTAASLEAAVAGDDAEIRWRAKQVLDRIDRESRSLLHAVLTTIEKEKVQGLAGPLFGATDFCREGYLQTALRRSLAATATPEDVPLLRQALQAQDALARIAALHTLAILLEKRADADALVLLHDENESVRAAAAQVLAGHGRRESLSVLVKLLESSDISVRVEAFRILRALTGEHFHYTGYDPPEKRAAAVAEWRKWLEMSSATAPLNLPLSDLPADLGRVLVCEPGQNKVIEFDTNGQKIWERQVGQQPWACQGLPNGHRLVGSYNERTIVEYDNEGNEVWRMAGLPGGPTGVERLENGNTLVACTEGNQVVEVDPEKKIVWRATLEGRPVDAHRLDDGRTLVALQNAQKIVEVDSSGKVVWEIGGVGMVFSAQRLPDGNTLVCSLNTPQVREFDTAGKVVWAEGTFANPYTAQRLPDGNTMVVDREGVAEIDPKGHVVRKIRIINPSRAWRY